MNARAIRVAINAREMSISQIGKFNCDSRYQVRPNRAAVVSSTIGYRIQRFGNGTRLVFAAPTADRIGNHSHH